MEAIHAESDWADIRATLGGDEDAYARLVTRYQALVFNQMWRFTRVPNVQEELVQEVFVEVYRSLKSFKGRSPFLHWIRRIATRVGYRYWKYKAKGKRLREAIEQQPAGRWSEPEKQEPSEAVVEYDRRLVAKLLGILLKLRSEIHYSISSMVGPK